MVFLKCKGPTRLEGEPLIENILLIFFMRNFFHIVPPHSYIIENEKYAMNHQQIANPFDHDFLVIFLNSIAYGTNIAKSYLYPFILSLYNQTLYSPYLQFLFFYKIKTRSKINK